MRICDVWGNNSFKVAFGNLEDKKYTSNLLDLAKKKKNPGKKKRQNTQDIRFVLLATQLRTKRRRRKKR